MKGAVKAYDARRGVGTIVADRGGAEIAVHSNEIESAGLARLSVGERLSFDLKTDRALGRTFAVNLSRV